MSLNICRFFSSRYSSSKPVQAHCLCFIFIVQDLTFKPQLLLSTVRCGRRSLAYLSSLCRTEKHYVISFENVIWIKFSAKGKAKTLYTTYFLLHSFCSMFCKWGDGFEYVRADKNQALPPPPPTVNLVFCFPKAEHILSALIQVY